MTTDRVISSFALPRHLGGHVMAFDETNPPQPPPPPPPPAPPPAPPPTHYTPPAPPPAPPGPPAREDSPEMLRAEAAASRVRAREAREAADASARETERVRAEAAQQVQAAQHTAQQSTAKFKERTAAAELKAQAVASGLVDPDLVGLIDRSTITVDDDGNVTGVTEAIEAFKVKKPNYFTAGGSIQPPAPPPRSSTGAPGPVPPPGGAPGPTIVTKIPADEYKAKKAAALSALKG